jgi:phosphate transport system ATP-binding protein
MDKQQPLDPSSIITRTTDLNIYYGKFHAVKDIGLQIQKNKITAIIGPSGCGKSTVLRCFNRMNDFIPATRVEGKIYYKDLDINDPTVDPVRVRQMIGMVFQRPNPFPKSIYDNIAWGAKVNGIRKNLDDLVEKSLRQAALWDEVKDSLQDSGLSLSGGQQQRLCIARTLAVEPEIILMDEPCSALDPLATLKIEELMRELSRNYTIIIVTHNMQQAARVSDFTAFMIIDENRTGYLAEFGGTKQIFLKPNEKSTEDYITGRFG